MGSSATKEQRDYTEGLPDYYKDRLPSRQGLSRPLTHMRVTPKSVGCCGNCVKTMIGCMSTLVYAFNLFFFVLGALLLAAGIYSQLQLGDLTDLLNIPLSICMIVLGAVVVVLTFFGCVGAYCQKRGLLKIYWILLVIVVILQIIGGAVIYADRDELQQQMGKTWHDASPALRQSFQKQFNCCGWGNSTDYPAPSSTCPAIASKLDSPPHHDDGKESDGNNPPLDPNQGLPGCQQAIVSFFDEQILVLEITAIVVSSIELVVLVFSFCLIFLIRPDRDEDDISYESVRMLDDM